MRVYVLLLLVLPLVVMAQNATRIQWEPPTSFEDGTPLSQATDLSEYRLYCRKDSEVFGDRPPYVIAITGDEIEHHTDRRTVLGEFGEYQCAMTAYTTTGLESAYSNEVAVAWVPAPGAPRNLIILVD